MPLDSPDAEDTRGSPAGRGGSGRLPRQVVVGTGIRFGEKKRNRCDSRGRVIMAGSTGRSETQVTERSGTVIDTFPSFGHEEWMPGEERSVVDEHTNCGPASGWGGHGLGVPRVRQLEEGPAPGSSGYVRNVGCKVSVTRAGSSGHGIPNCTPCFTGAPLWNPPRPTLLP